MLFIKVLEHFRKNRAWCFCISRSLLPLVFNGCRTTSSEKSNSALGTDTSLLVSNFYFNSNVAPSEIGGCFQLIIRAGMIFVGPGRLIGSELTWRGKHYQGHVQTLCDTKARSCSNLALNPCEKLMSHINFSHERLRPVNIQLLICLGQRSHSYSISVLFWQARSGHLWHQWVILLWRWFSCDKV